MAVRKAPDNALVVRTFAYPTTTEGRGRSDTGTRPLADVRVELRKGTGNVHTAVSGPRPTGPDGEVRFDSLPEATDYRLIVQEPTGFEVPLHLFIDGVGPLSFKTNGSHTASRAIKVKEGGDVVVEIGITPKLGKVTGTVVVHTPGNAAISAPVPIRVEGRSDGLLVDSKDVAPAPTPGQAFTLDIDRPGLIEVIAQSPIQQDDRTYEPRPVQASQFVLVQAGATVAKIDIEYEPAGAELLVGAQLVEETNGQVERRPLDGVTFQLFPPGADKPEREVRTQPNTVSAFSELAAATYRVVAKAPAASNGQRLQLTRPSTAALSVVVGDGQQIDLTQAFEFRPVRGSVVGSVVLSRDDTPVPDVAVVLSSLQQPPILRQKVTNSEGEYEINELPPGKYRVTLQQAVVTAFGSRWELEDEGAGRHDVEVRPRATALVPELRLVEEEHLIKGKVLGPDGVGAPFVVVLIFDDVAAPAPAHTVVTDEHGIYEFRAPTPGIYFLRVQEQNGVASQLTPVTVNRPTEAPDLSTSTRQPAGSGTGSGGSPAPTTELNDFPFLTEEVDLGGRGGPAQPAGGVGAVGQTVERALREVLGWRPRASDPKGFQAALLQAFSCEEVAGHTVCHWNPRSYAVEIQADLGAVTGAQASLYTRAKAAVDQVLPLLDGLEPLRVDFDPENISAIRAIVRSQLTELVKELGVEGGPRVQRVDQLFSFLLGDTIVAADPRARRDPDLVGGSLGILRDRFGLQRFRINELKEEETFSNFLIVVDHVVSLAESWDAQREFFVRGSTLVEPFLGTQLVLLSRDLEVVAESVHEVEFALDSVFLGPSERQTLELRFRPDPAATGATPGTGNLVARSSPPMFLSELLSWVERFATEEGRQLIDEGGKQAIAVAFRPTLLLLQTLVRQARVAPAGAQDPTRMPDAYRRPRVQRALAELESQLAAAAARVEQFRAPNGPVALTQPPVTTQLPPRPRPQPPAPPTAGPNEDRGRDTTTPVT